MSHNHNVLRRLALPLALLAGGVVVGVVADKFLDKNISPYIEAQAICPKDTQLVVTETHKLLSSAAIQLSCQEDGSGMSVAPYAVGYPGIQALSGDSTDAAPASTFYLDYKAGAMDPPELNNWGGGTNYDSLHLVGASAIIGVEFQQPADVLPFTG
jgi:hypothetical protein